MTRKRPGRRVKPARRAPLSLYFPGPDGLQPGDLLPPRVWTDDWEILLAHLSEGTLDDLVEGDCDLWLTSDLDLAIDLAAHPQGEWGGSTVYLAQPLGELEPDEEFPDGVSYVATRVRVTAAVRTEIPEGRSPTGALRRLARWNGGEPMYDAEGRLQLLPVHRRLGLVEADFDVLGPFPLQIDVFEVIMTRTAELGTGFFAPGEWEGLGGEDREDGGASDGVSATGTGFDAGTAAGSGAGAGSDPERG